MSAKESKWFGKYQNDYQYHQYQPQYWNNQHLNPHQKWNTNQHSQHNQYFGKFANSIFWGAFLLQLSMIYGVQGKVVLNGYLGFLVDSLHLTVTT